MLRLISRLLFLIATVSCFIMSTPSPQIEFQTFSVLFAGDILIANKVEDYIKMQGIEYPFMKIKDELLKYDFVFANLESPVTNRGKPFNNKPYIFRVKPENAVCLKDLKIDVVSIENNHL